MAASINREELRPVVAITLGDPAGVGAEVTLKALADPEIQRSAQFIVLGDRAAVTPAERSTGVRLDTLPVEFRDCHTLPTDTVIAMGTLAGLYRARGKPQGVIWIDAHGDINTPLTSPSVPTTRMVMRIDHSFHRLSHADSWSAFCWWKACDGS